MARECPRVWHRRDERRGAAGGGVRKGRGRKAITRWRELAHQQRGHGDFQQQRGGDEQGQVFHGRLLSRAVRVRRRPAR